MKNEDKVYLYSDGSMCRVINKNDKDVKQVDPFIIRKNLKILGSFIEDDGLYFVLRDDNNKIYYMSQDDFNRYVEKHDIILDSEFEFVRKDNTQSIREVNTDNGWISLNDKKPDVVELCMTNKEFYAISKPLRIKTYAGCDFIARYKITLDAYGFPINHSVFMIDGLNKDATLDYDKVQYWKEFEEE